VVATDAASNASTQAVTLAINNVNEFSIFFSSDNSSVVDVPAGLSAGVSIGINVQAEDPDVSTGTDDAITYSLARNLSGDPYLGQEFSVNSSTGEVLTGAVPPVLSDQNTRTIFVKATSSDGSVAIQQFTILIVP
jgi:hypothetical protein